MVTIGSISEAWAVTITSHLLWDGKKRWSQCPRWNGSICLDWGVRICIHRDLYFWRGFSLTFNLPGDDPETPAKEGGVDGDNIISLAWKRNDCPDSYLSSGV